MGSLRLTIEFFCSGLSGGLQSHVTVGYICDTKYKQSPGASAPVSCLFPLARLSRADGCWKDTRAGRNSNGETNWLEA